MTRSSTTSKSKTQPKPRKTLAATAATATALVKTGRAAVKAKLARDRPRLTKLLTIIEASKRTMTKSAIAMGKALKEIRDAELWRCDTDDGFEAFLSYRDLVSAVYARKLIDVVEALPNAKALPYGVEKTWELDRYAADSSHRGGLKGLLAKKATIADRPVLDLSTDEVHDERMKLKINVNKSVARDPQRVSMRKLAATASAVLSKRYHSVIVVKEARNGDDWQFAVTYSERVLRSIAELPPVKSGTKAKKQRKKK